MSEYVYILTHSKIPGLIKIGRTENVKERMKTLASATGVPGPFEYYYSRKVKDAGAVEKRLQEELKKNRIGKTEFFELEPGPAKVMLQSPPIYNATSSKKPKGHIDQKSNSKTKKIRASAFSFIEVGIPLGSEISLRKDPKIIAIVVNDRQVEYRGRRTSLSPLTKELLNLRHTPQGPAYWVYKGQVLAKMRS